LRALLEEHGHAHIDLLKVGLKALTDNCFFALQTGSLRLASFFTLCKDYLLLSGVARTRVTLPSCQMDIEGGEWEVLEELCASPLPLPFDQLIVELHNLNETAMGTRSALL
jgi:hypothetical protein